MLSTLSRSIERVTEALSRRLRIDISYLLQGTVWGALGQVVSAGSAFALSVLFAHFATKETVGTYRYILSVANMLTAFTLSGLNTSIIQSVARGYDEAFTSSFRKSLLWSIPAMIGTITIGAYYALQGNLVLGWGIAIAGILVNVWNALLLFRSFLNGKKALFVLFLSNAAVSLFPIGALILSFFRTQDPASLVTVFLSVSCLVTAGVHRYASHRFAENDIRDPHHDRYSQHLSLLYILDTFASQLDKVLVFQLIGSASLATYTYATAFIEQMRALTKTVQTAILPKFSVRPTSHIRKELPRKIALSTIGLLGVALLYIVCAPFLFRLFFPTYLDAVWLSQVFALILIFENGLVAVALKAKRAIREQYVSNILGNIVKIGLMIVLLRVYGLIGLVMARVLARAFGFGFAFVLAKRLKDEPEEHSRPQE